MSAAQRCSRRRVSPGNRLDEVLVCGVIFIAAECHPQAKHVDHGSTQTRGEAVEQLQQDRVVRRGDDCAMKGGVGVDMAFDFGTMLRSRGESLTNSPNISRRATFSRKCGGLAFDRDASLDDRQDVGAPKHGVPALRRIERGDEHP